MTCMRSIEQKDNMTEDIRKGEIPFQRAREELEKQVEAYLKSGKMAEGSVREMPNIQLEKGLFQFSFAPVEIGKEKLCDALQLIKRHIENVRIHTFEPGYVIYQAMGENLYDLKNLSVGIKFRFSWIGSTNKVDVSRKADLTQDEIFLCAELFKLFHPPSGSVQNPIARLESLGGHVYSPEEKGEVPISGEGLAGYEQTRMEIQECVVMPLKNPEVFQNVAKLARGKMDGILPRAILFEGPPGVGKTTMARLVSRETGIPLVYIPIESIMSKYYGESASNMSAIFDAAKNMKRVILFLDEIDSLAGSREQGMFEATRRVLSVLLRKIDGFEGSEGVLTIGATNRAEDLDRALLSRFDHRIRFPLPNGAERSAIFGVYAKHLTSEELALLGEGTPGFSGRNIQDVCEYAERRWARMLISDGKEASPPEFQIYKEIAEMKKINL